MTEEQPSKKAVDLGRINYAKVTKGDAKKESKEQKRKLKQLMVRLLNYTHCFGNGGLCPS